MIAPLLAAAVLLVPGADAQQELSVRPFARGLSALTAIASTPAEPRRVYAVEQVGRIRYFVNGRLRGTFLDIRDRVVSGGEQGLLSVAFSPGYARNHRFYVDYTDKNGNTRVVEFRSRNDRGLKSTARQLLFVRHPIRITTAAISSSIEAVCSMSAWATAALPETPATGPSA